MRLPRLLPNRHLFRNLQHAASLRTSNTLRSESVLMLALRIRPRRSVVVPPTLTMDAISSVRVKSLALVALIRLLPLRPRLLLPLPLRPTLALLPLSDVLDSSRTLRAPLVLIMMTIHLLSRVRASLLRLRVSRRPRATCLSSRPRARSLSLKTGK